MESQVLRAVQHARSRPKQEALSLEGALGKIAFHGSGRPRALLDVRKPINAEENKVLTLEIDIYSRLWGIKIDILKEGSCGLLRMSTIFFSIWKRNDDLVG